KERRLIHRPSESARKTEFVERNFARASRITRGTNRPATTAHPPQTNQGAPTCRARKIAPTRRAEKISAPTAPPQPRLPTTHAFHRTHFRDGMEFHDAPRPTAFVSAPPSTVVRAAGGQIDEKAGRLPPASSRGRLSGAPAATAADHSARPCAPALGFAERLRFNSWIASSFSPSSARPRYALNRPTVV